MGNSDTPPALERAEARLPRWMAGFAVLGVAIGLVALRARFAAGLALGAAVSVMAYYWLHQTVRVLLDSGRARPPKMVVVKYILRYPVALGAIYLFYRTKWLPFEGVVVGLFVPVAAVIAEALVQIVAALRSPST